MSSRTDLHAKLVTILGSNNVYFQPPETIKMSYPCIIYELSKMDTEFADDKVYKFDKAYTVTVVDKSPVTTIPDSIVNNFAKCRFDRFYTFDNLNHYVFNIYF